MPPTTPRTRLRRAWNITLITLLLTVMIGGAVVSVTYGLPLGPP